MRTARPRAQKPRKHTASDLPNTAREMNTQTPAENPVPILLWKTMLADLPPDLRTRELPAP